MSDAADYFRSYAARAICKARNMPFGRLKRLQRSVGRIYHLLTKEAAFTSNVQHLDDFRVARTLEKQVDDSRQLDKSKRTTVGARHESVGSDQNPRPIHTN